MCSGIKQKNASSGFTIVELIIATAVFSVVLLVVTTGIIKIGQNYYKNLTQNKVQETSRAISDDLTQTIQFANGEIRAGGSANQFCIGDVRYTFNINRKLDAAAGVTDALKADRITPSTPCAAAGAPGRELLADNMRLLDFYVGHADPTGRTWNVRLTIGYGDNDLFTHYNTDGTANGEDPATATCRTGAKGGQFCAVSKLDTLIKRRLNN